MTEIISFTPKAKKATTAKEIKENLQLSPEEKEARQKEIKALHNLYKFKKTREGWQMKFKKIEFLKLLKSFGFYVYEVDINTFKFVHAHNNLLTEINEKAIISAFLKYIDTIPTLEELTISEAELENIPEEERATYIKKVTSDQIKEEALNSLENLFNKKLLCCLSPEKTISIMTDEKAAKYLFYSNGFIKVSSNGSSFFDYGALTGHIWKDQILKRNYRQADNEKSYFEKFCYNICTVYNDDKSLNEAETLERFKSLKTLIGYNLHNYTACKLYATILTDSKLDDDGEANGRTGKTLLAKGIGQMLNTEEKATVYCEVAGRNWNYSDKFRYSRANLDTQLLHINDVPKYFDIEYLFNDITEGVTVKKEHEKSFTIHSKIIVSTNKTIKVEGDSAKDRTIIFELSDYYNINRSPLTEFKHWFFDEWAPEEWHRFDSFMIGCLRLYFETSIYRTGTINLEKRTLNDHTHRDFVRWIEYKFKEKDDEGNINFERLEINQKTTVLKKRYNKKELYSEFTNENQDFLKNKYFDQRRFTSWLKLYIKLTYKGAIITEEIRSSGQDYIIFTEI